MQYRFKLYPFGGTAGHTHTAPLSRHNEGHHLFDVDRDIGPTSDAPPEYTAWLHENCQPGEHFSVHRGFTHVRVPPCRDTGREQYAEVGYFVVTVGERKTALAFEREFVGREFPKGDR